MFKAILEAFAAAHADGATVIDVRAPDDDLTGHVVGAVLTPMGQLPARTGELNHGLPVTVVCATGDRNSAVAEYLASAGFDISSAAGGTAALSQVETPRHYRRQTRPTEPRRTIPRPPPLEGKAPP
jgi:rhodanese-related sulfurtransferase